MTEQLRETRSVQIGTAVTPTEKAAFQAFSREHGMTPSEMVRLLISKVCPDIELGEANRKVSDRKTERVTIRWAASDMPLLDQMAKQEGTTRQGWLRKVARRLLYEVPQFSDAEMTALNRSTYELAAIGRNLNQIARRINQNPYETSQMTPQLIAELHQVVQQHVEQTRAMMNANWMRFGGEADGGI